MSTQDITAHQSIELCDLSCPHLLIAVIKAIKAVESGQVLQIKATDLNAPSSIASWSRQSGNLLLDLYEENGCFIFLLQRDGQESAALMEQHNFEKVSTEG